MTITATELKRNLSKYLEIAKKEDVIITKNGKPVAQLTRPSCNALDSFFSFAGSLPSNVDFEKEKLERISK